jgi:GMP synthase-like glutamine amidotransferase
MSEREPSRLRALILQHEGPTPPGHVTEWLAEHDADVDILRIDLEDRRVDPTDYDLIVSLGSEFAAFDDTKAFVPREAELMREAVEADVPVLGLCFGGQMLARVLGADVYRSDTSEIGWLPVRSKDPDLVPDGPWFQWHFDTFTVPPGARLLARSALCPQAFARGTSVGLQFHPEATPEIIDGWIRAGGEGLARSGVDAQALAAQTRRAGPGARERAYTLFDAIARLWTNGRGTSVQT